VTKSQIIKQTILIHALAIQYHCNYLYFRTGSQLAGNEQKLPSPLAFSNRLLIE